MSQQLTVTGTFNDGSTANITAQATWTCDDTTIATVSSPGGLISYATAGKLRGGVVGVTGTIGALTGTVGVRLVAADSGSQLMPLSDQQWVDCGLSPWGAYGGCQEATGNLVLSGSAGHTLTALAGAGIGVQYLQSVNGGGWTRLAVAVTGTLGTQVAAASGTGPNLNGTSVGWLGYITLGAGTPSTPFLGAIAGNNANVIALYHNSNANSGAPQILTNTGQKFLVGPGQRHSDRVHPYLLVYNRTTSEIWAATDVSVAMTGGMSGINDDAKGFGTRGSSTSCSASIVYYATATGSIVERLCSTSASADFLSRLGWSVRWKTCPTDSSSIKLPFTPDHYTQLGLLPWTAVWNMQDAFNGPARSFNAWDSRDSLGWSLNAGTTLSYERPVPNWSRNSIMVTGAGSQKMSRLCVYGSPPQYDPTGSFAILAYALVNGSGLVGQLVGMGNSTALTTVATSYVLQTTFKPVLYCAGETVTGSISVSDGLVHPFLVVYDRTNSRYKYYDDLQKLTGTFVQTQIVNSVTASMGFGSAVAGVGNAVSGSYLYFAFTTGTLAESLSSDGNASSFLKTLGWNVAW